MHQWERSHGKVIFIKNVLCINILIYMLLFLQHFPKHVGDLLNINGDNNLLLIDEETQKTYACRIYINRRNESIKYIGNGWFEYMTLKKFDVGFVVMFNFEIETRRLYVCLAAWV